MKRLDLSYNTLSGVIPSEIGQFLGASVLMRGNDFNNSSTAPLSLCLLRSVNDFDLANDNTEVNHPIFIIDRTWHVEFFHINIVGITTIKTCVDKLFISLTALGECLIIN